MKLNKIYAIALAALTLTACSDDDDTSYNTASDVTVSMEEATMSVPEDNSGIIKVPVVVSGKANGTIKVTVEVQGVGSNPAKADEHYILTSDYIYIPDDQTEGNIEFHATGDDEINENREFSIKIVNVEGAKIGTQTTTTITLKDDDHLIPEAYSATVGDWIMSCNRGQYPVTVTGYPEGNPKYGKEVNIVGIGGDPDFTAVAQISVDPNTEKIKLTFVYGQQIGVVNTSEFGQQNVLLIGFDGQYIYPSGSQSAVSNEARDTFVFAQGLAGCFNVGGWYSVWTQLNMFMSKVSQ